MNYPAELVGRYAEFYRPRLKRGRPTAAGAVKPLTIASKILLHPDNLRMQDDEIKLAIASETGKLMQQIHRSTAEGFWVLEGELERSAIEEFARFFVENFFREGCYGRRDLLSGNKFSLITHSCEWLISDKAFAHHG